MSKDQELKFVTRQETFNDLAVRELAKGRSACLCRIQFGRCTKSECESCAIHKQYENCYNALSDYDRQRLASYVAEYWQEDSLWSGQWRSPSGYVRHELCVVFMAILFLLVVCGIICGIVKWADSPYDKPFNLYDEYISECISENNDTVRDYNKDGEVNCVDYACGFKATWDKLYPELAPLCEIVRNLNIENGMHHLFIVIDGVEVEPWTFSTTKYRMCDNWDATYNPSYNIYGETNLWMRECELNN